MSFSTGQATWDIGVLTQDEYEALYMALAYFTDPETLGDPPDAEDKRVIDAKALMNRLEVPSGA